MFAVVNQKPILSLWWAGRAEIFAQISACSRRCTFHIREYFGLVPKHLFTN